MQVSSLFDLIAESRNVLDLFDGVETRDQLVSRLERLKKGPEASDLMESIDGLRYAVAAALKDTLEMSASIDESDDSLDEELEKLTASLESSDSPPEDPKPPEPPATEIEKNEEPPAS
jgi:hypothetical protein